jgi:hypothetical protein
VVVAFVAGFFFGRSTAPASSPATSSPPFAAAASNDAPTPFPSAAPRAPMMAAPVAPMAAMPMAGAAQQAGPNGGPSESPVSGTVKETIQVPNFTYLKLATASGEEWAAVPTNSALKAGDAVTIVHPLKMTDFNSKTLNRTFPEIWFGDVGK